MRKLSLVRIGILLTAVVAVGFFAQPVFAKKTFLDNQAALNTVVQKTGHEKTDVITFASKVINTAFTAVGIVFFALMVYAGYRWMTARGKEDDISTARETLINATIGLILIVGAYAITNFVTTRIISGKSSGSQTVSTPNAFGEEPLGCCIVEANSAYVCSVQTEAACQTTCQNAPTLADGFSGTKKAGCAWDPTAACAVKCDELNQEFK